MTMKGSVICPAWSFGRTSLLLLLLLSFTAQGQWDARARLDTQRIRIGEQPILTLTLEYMENEKKGRIELPKVADRLGEHIEVVEQEAVDTLIPHEDKAPELRRVEQRFRITSFDSGHHRIPPFHFRMNGDSISTPPLLLKVSSVELGKSKEPKGIKGIERFPYSWSAWLRDQWPWFAAGAAALLIAVLLFLYYRKRGEKQAKEPVDPPRPPHEVALEKLRAMEAEKAWQEKDPKAFYTELTDTLRHYMEERYRIPALETTTARILHELSFTGIDDEGKASIRSILKKADMVKFAKQQSSSEERERSLKEGIAFVENSIPALASEEQEESEQGR